MAVYARRVPAAWLGYGRRAPGRSEYRVTGYLVLGVPGDRLPGTRITGTGPRWRRWRAATQPPIYLGSGGRTAAVPRRTALGTAVGRPPWTRWSDGPRRCRARPGPPRDSAAGTGRRFRTARRCSFSWTPVPTRWIARAWTVPGCHNRVRRLWTSLWLKCQRYARYSCNLVLTELKLAITNTYRQNGLCQHKTTIDYKHSQRGN